MIRPPSVVVAIENCFAVLERYTDIESVVALSQTCRALHDMIIDETTRKVKISHFEVQNFPIPHNPTDQEPPDSLIKNWCTAPARIPHYLTRALNSIHFPSLRHLHLDFPLTRRRNLHVIEDVCYASFPIFVTNLGYACNLEYLHFDARRLMNTERMGHMEAIYEMLSINLQSCTKLRELSVNNVGVDRNGSCLWSVVLLQALVPTILKRKDELTSMKIHLSGTASDPVYEQHLLHRGIDVTFDFFSAMLSLSCVEVTEIEFSLDHMDALLRAFSPIHSLQKPTNLTTLKISQYPSTDEKNDFASSEHMLEHFAECHQLTNLHLDLPASQWEDTHISLKRLICNKPKIESLSLCFSCYEDIGGKMMNALVEFGGQNSLHALKEISIFGLFNTSSQDFSVLQNSMAEKGMYSTRCRQKFGKTSPQAFHLIICMFEKQGFR